MMKVQLIWDANNEVEELNCFDFKLEGTLYVFSIPWENKDGRVKYCVAKKALKKVVRVS